MHFITLLLTNLLRRRARSLLTCGGVAVAIGTTVALLGISQGLEDASVEALGGRGVEVLVIQEGVLDQLSSDLDQSLMDRIGQVEGVAEVGTGLVELIDYSAEGTVLSVVVNGWVPGSFVFDGVEMIEGRTLEPGDERTVILGETLAENIGKGLGETVVLQRTEFEVVGIYRSFSLFENGAMAAPLDQLQRIMARDGSVTGFSIRLEKSAGGSADAAEVCRRINDLVDENGELLGLKAQPTEEFVTGSMHIRVAHAMAWLTSAIALFVGCIGMLNTMLMSVVERIREISILRAIGWRKSLVVRMVLGECLLLSLAGAAIGVGLALLLVMWLTTLPMASGFIDGRIAPSVVGLGFLIALPVGVLGGAYPAYRAARLVPSEGLAHE